MVIASALSLKARKEGTKTLYITAIVFGAISGLEGAVVGGIFGLFGSKNEKEQDKVVEVK